MQITGVMRHLRSMTYRCLPKGGVAVRAAWGLVAALLAASAAHAGFSNGGFEDNSTLPPTNWTLKTYTRSADLPASPPPAGATLAQLGLSNAAVGNGVSALINLPIANVPSTNPGTLTAPRWGTRAFKLNDQGAKQASSVEQTATMTTADIDPVDNKIHIRFGMAPVLVDGGHSATQQPYFYVEVFNITKNKVLFNTYNYANQSGVPWQTQGSYRYTDWQGFDVSPGNGQLDVGDSVRLIVYASNCSPGAAAHEARVYLDAVGAFMPGLTVAATGPSTTKPGASITYTYTYANGSGAIALDSVVRVSAPKTEDGLYTTFDPGWTKPANCQGPYPGEQIAAATAGPPATPAVYRGDYILCTVGNGGMVNDGESGSFDVTFQVPSGAATTGPSNVVNNGDYNISASTVSPYIGPLVKTTIVSAVTTTTDLAVTIDNGSVVSYVPGDTVNYTATVENKSGATVPGDVTWTLKGVGACADITTMPPGATCSDASGNPVITFSTSTLAPGGIENFTVTATAQTVGTPVNTVVSVTPNGATDTDTSNNTAGMNTPVSAAQHDVTANASGTGAGHILAVPAALACGNAGTACDATGTTKPVGVGDEVRLTPVAHAGSLFKGWTGCTSLDGNVCVITMGTSDVTATAEFAKAYIVTPSQPGTGGSIGPSTPQQVEEGGSKVFTLTPDAGKYPVIDPPASGTACTGTLDTSVTPNTYTVSPVTADCGFTVTFSSGVTLTSSVTGGSGTITPSGNTALLQPGNNNTVYTFNPDPGYVPVVGGTCQGVFDGTVTPNTYTVTNATADCTVIASFTNDPVTVTSSTSSGHGTIDTTGTINLPNGGSRTYTFTPDTGYYPLVTGNCPGTLVGNTYTVSSVAADCAFDVAFTNATVDITATVTSGTGTITSPGVTTIAQGGSKTYIAAPGGGNVTVFESTSTCPGTRSGNVYSVTGAAANCSVDVKFVATASAVTVTTSVPGGHGTVTTPGQDASGDTVLAIGDTRVWNVTPATGYIPKVQSSTCVPAGTLSATAPYTYTLTAAASCAVAFAFVPAATSIPTLSEWGLAILSALMGLAMVGMRRRQMF